MDRFRPDIKPLGIKKKLNIEDRPVILFVGALGPWHGVQNMIKAMPLIIEKAPDAKLLIIGGAKEDKIEVIKSLINKVDNLIISGVLSNTFLNISS